MLPEEWPRARSVLTEALKVPTGDRTRFIEDAFPNNPRMWDELLAILDGYDKATHSDELQWSEDPELNKLLPTVAPVPGTGSEPGKTTSVLLVGEQYGSYRVVRELKPGGMGQVFLAEDVRMPRRVVLKSLAGKWLESPAAHQRFRLEANSACVLNHGNVATLYDVVEDRGQFLLVFEYVEGRTLRHVLGDGRLPLGHALRLAVQLTDAITYAHDQGILHCDIKPENIQITPDNKVKVLDFGLARARWGSAQGTEPERGKLMGTAGYMAPERLIRGTLNASGDIYCIGVVLFELLTGRHPYPERGPSQVLAVLGTDAPRASSLVGGVSPDLDMILERALSRDSSLRYQSGRELAIDLRRVLDRIDAPVAAPASQRDEKRDHGKRDPTFWILAGVAAIPAVVIVLSVTGFASIALYNSALGRTGGFEPDSPLWWPIRGIQVLISPAFVAIVVSVLISLASFFGRLAAMGPIGRLLAPVISVMRRIRDSIRSQPAAFLAPTVLLIEVTAALIAFWTFQDVFHGLDSFISKRPPIDLSPLRPENRSEHNWMTVTFTSLVVVFGLIWYWIYRHRRQRGEREAIAVIFAGVAVTSFCLLVGQIFPRWILYKSTHERVTYQSRPCYLVGEQGSDGLIFCPQQPPPWNEIVKLNDPALRREGVVESIFTGFNRGQ